MLKSLRLLCKRAQAGLQERGCRRSISDDVGSLVGRPGCTRWSDEVLVHAQGLAATQQRPHDEATGKSGQGRDTVCRPPRWPFITAAPLRQHHVSPCCSAEVSMQLRHALRPVAAAALGTWQRRHRRTRCSAAAAALGAVPLPQVLVPRTTPPVRQDEWCVADGDLRRRVLTPSLPARSSQGQHGGLDRQAAGMDIF